MNHRGTGAGGDQKKIVDFNQVREKRLEEKRRRTERVFLKNMISVFSVVDQGHLRPIELIDMSDDGCSFQIPFNLKNPVPWPQQANDLPLRLYFSRSTFLEIQVQVQNSSAVYENETRYVRFGCTVDKGTVTYPAYEQFVRFLKLYSEQCRSDNGKVTAFYPS